MILLFKKCKLIKFVLNQYRMWKPIASKFDSLQQANTAGHTILFSRVVSTHCIIYKRKYTRSALKFATELIIFAVAVLNLRSQTLVVRSNITNIIVTNSFFFEFKTQPNATDHVVSG